MITEEMVTEEMITKYHVWCPNCGSWDYICAADEQEAEDALEHKGRCSTQAIAELKKPVSPPPRLP